MTERDYARGRMAELASSIIDQREQLEEVWRMHEERFGPEMDPQIRDTVARALGR